MQEFISGRMTQRRLHSRKEGEQVVPENAVRLLRRDRMTEEAPLWPKTLNSLRVCL